MFIASFSSLIQQLEITETFKWRSPNFVLPWLWYISKISGNPHDSLQTYGCFCAFSHFMHWIFRIHVGFLPHTQTSRGFFSNIMLCLRIWTNMCALWRTHNSCFVEPMNGLTHLVKLLVEFDIWYMYTVHIMQGSVSLKVMLPVQA